VTSDRLPEVSCGPLLPWCGSPLSLLSTSRAAGRGSNQVAEAEALATIGFGADIPSAVVSVRCEYEALPKDSDTDLEELFRGCKELGIPGVSWSGFRRVPLFFGLEKMVAIVRLHASAGDDDSLADRVSEVLQGMAAVQSAKLLSMAVNAPDTFATCSRLFSADPGGLHRLSLPCLGVVGATALVRHGYAILDNFVPSAVVDGVSELIKASLAVRAQGGDDGIDWRTPEPRHARTDVATWLTTGRRPASDTVFAEGLGPKIEALAADLCSLMAGMRGSVELQLACFPAGAEARYRRHTDANATGCPKSLERKVTCILYCNPTWREVSAGKLRLTQADHDGGGTVDIAPVGGRLLCFLSGAMTHEVLPTKDDRYAVTAWVS